jgi:hypothetical protein
MRLEFFVVAENVSVDRTTNELSVFNVMESLRADVFPGVIPKCVAVSLWRLEPGDEGQDWQATIRIYVPGENVQEFPTNFRSQPGATRHRVTQRIYGLPLRQAGDLRFELLLNGQHSADHVATVQMAEEGAPVGRVPG